MGLMQHAFRILRGRRGLALVLALSSIGLDSCSNPVKPIVTAASAAVQEATLAIGNAVNALGDQSASWQDVLKQLESGLSADAKSLIDNDVQGIVTRTVDQAGVEFRCDVSFVNQQVANDLLALKAKLLGQAPPVAQPQVCQGPEFVDLSKTLTTATFYGYNFDLKFPFEVRVVHVNGSETIVPASFVNIPTAYALSVTLAGLGLGPDTPSMTLYWNGKPLQSIGILTPQVPPPVCDTKVVEPNRAEVGTIGPFFPPRVNNGGDKDFDGHGPRIQVGAQISNTATQVSARLYMDARETQKDFTEVQGYSTWTVVFTADPGYVIDTVSTPTSVFPPAYVDNHNGTTVQPFRLATGAGGLVNTFLIVGDQDGDDVGRASVAAMFNHLSIVERKSGGCVSAQMLSKAIAAGKVSPALASAVAGKLAASRALIQAAGVKAGP